MEALQGGLAGVAGGGGEDEDGFIHALDGFGGGEQLGQHAQRHILKGRGGAPEQLQHVVRPHGNGGGQLFRLEFSGVGPLHQRLHIGDIREQGAQNGGFHSLGGKSQAIAPVKFRQGFGHV